MKRLRARKTGLAVAVAAATALLGAAAALAAYGGSATVTTYSGNPSCVSLGYPAGLKIEAGSAQYPASGTYSDGSLVVNMTVNSSANPISIDFSANTGIQAVLVKAGPGGLRYSYPVVVTSDSGLESPVADSISHVEFCYLHPTAVRVQSLAARATGTGVAVTWRAGVGARSVGYSVYRETGGKRIRLNRTLVAAIAGPGMHAYRWIDRGGTSGSRYWIQAVGLDGMRAWYGSVRAS